MHLNFEQLVRSSSYSFRSLLGTIYFKKSACKKPEIKRLSIAFRKIWQKANRIWRRYHWGPIFGVAKVVDHMIVQVSKCAVTIGKKVTSYHFAKNEFHILKRGDEQSWRKVKERQW